MISNLISKAFWYSYDKQQDAATAEHKKTKEVLAKTNYLSSHPDSVFFVKPF